MYHFGLLPIKKPFITVEIEMRTLPGIAAGRLDLGALCSIGTRQFDVVWCLILDRMIYFAPLKMKIGWSTEVH